ncbi:hypothetical protein GIB67_035726 [Kingdonia uniflora]|nr:hypothetical protein GIB67_035726 [Kingdonia uniflora]
MSFNMKRGGDDNARLPYHVVVTVSNSPYRKWQCRIMYYWYKKVKNMVRSEMGGFTKVLHSGNPDNLMDEISTFVADSLPGGMDRVSEKF